MSELILYTTEYVRSQSKLWAEQQTVSPMQMKLAELSEATKQSISLYLKNVFRDVELKALENTLKKRLKP